MLHAATCPCPKLPTSTASFLISPSPAHSGCLPQVQAHLQHGLPAPARGRRPGCARWRHRGSRGDLPGGSGLKGWQQHCLASVVISCLPWRPCLLLPGLCVPVPFRAQPLEQGCLRSAVAFCTHRCCLAQEQGQLQQCSAPWRWMRAPERPHNCSQPGILEASRLLRGCADERQCRHELHALPVRWAHPIGNPGSCSQVSKLCQKVAKSKRERKLERDDGWARVQRERRAGRERYRDRVWNVKFQQQQAVYVLVTWPPQPRHLAARS